MMPRADGYELLRRLRANSEFGRTPSPRHRASGRGLDARRPEHRRQRLHRQAVLVRELVARAGAQIQIARARSHTLGLDAYRVALFEALDGPGDALSSKRSRVASSPTVSTAPGLRTPNSSTTKAERSSSTGRTARRTCPRSPASATADDGSRRRDRARDGDSHPRSHPPRAPKPPESEALYRTLLASTDDGLQNPRPKRSTNAKPLSRAPQPIAPHKLRPNRG